MFQHERYRSHRAVRELLERLTATEPLVLVLDDVHWADSASVELLGALLRRPPDAAVLIALAVRPRQMPERVAAALERAHRVGTLVRVELGALTRGEAREFLGDAVDGAAATALYDESGGNPFYLEQLARSLALEHTAGVPELSPADLEVPPAVAAALAEELALLSDGARLVLEGAAVAGDPFEPELAAAAAATPEASALEALDELLKLDLVRQTEVPRRFRFRHPLVRRAVYESTPGGWRLGAHERSAETLAARGASAAERAHHVERSARQGDAAAVATLREAGEAAAQRAPASAATWFGRRAPAPARCRAGRGAGRAPPLPREGAGRDRPVRRRPLRAAREHRARPGRVGRPARAAHDGLCRRRAPARPPRAGSRAARERDGRPARSRVTRGGGADDRARDGRLLPHGLRADARVGRASAEHRTAARRPAVDRRRVAVLAFASAASGATPDAETHRTEAAALVDDLADDELALRLDAAANLAGAELYLDRYEEAEAHADRAMAVGRATGQSEFIPLPYSILGQVKLLRGQLAEAAEMLDNAVEGARLSGNVQALAGNLVQPLAHGARRR